MNVDVGKGTGPDQISARLLKTLAYCIVAPVCKLFNNSKRLLFYGYIWSSANIVPLPNTKAVYQPNDFRP